MIELAALPNPFRDTVVQDAWQTPADVREIHAEAFQACVQGIESASHGQPDSLIVFGPAGSGKTHLLTRLQRHLAETGQHAPDRVLRCVFVFVRLQTAPRLLFQHVRRRLAADLMRRDQDITQLQRLIAHQSSARDGLAPGAGVVAVRVFRQLDHDALTAHLASVSQELGLPRDLCIILEHLICGRLVRDASAWLAGESLPERILAELGVGVDLEEDREQVAREVVTCLCRLAGETLPIVFCFDQVEALQRGLEDKDAFFRFGRMAADLCDADPNVFVITCLQSAVVESFRASIRQADRDRMAKREAVLAPLSAAQVERLVAARLESVPELRCRSSAPHYPLSASFIAGLAEETPCVPRRVLTLAARRYEALQRGEAARVVDAPDYLRHEFEERRAAAARTSAPADTTRLLLQGLEPLAAVSGSRVVHENLGTADFAIEGDRRVFVEIRNEADGRSIAPRLRQLLVSTPRSDGGRTVLLRDPRLPLSNQAKKTREYLQALASRGVPVVEPTVEALAALAALSEILADAKSGDLANDGTPISGRAVLDWLRGLCEDFVTEPVRDLVAAILREPETSTEETAKSMSHAKGASLPVDSCSGLGGRTGLTVSSGRSAEKVDGGCDNALGARQFK